MQEINFYFDYLSPFSYLAWINHKRLRNKAKFIYRPVLMTSLFSHFSIKPPAEVESKRNYLLKNTLRYAKEHSISFFPPNNHPANPLLALLLSLENVAQESQFEVIDTIWKNTWGRPPYGIDLSSEEDLKKILSKFDYDKLYALAQDRTTKQKLKQNIKDAIESGVFGVPTFVIQNELFWGNDSINDLEKKLDGKDLLDIEKYQYFLSKFTLS